MIFAFKYRLVLNCLLSYLCLNNNIVSCFNYLYHVVLSLIFSFLFIVFHFSCFVFSSYFYCFVFSIIIIIIILILFIMFYFVFYLSFLPLLLDSKPFLGLKFRSNLDPFCRIMHSPDEAQESCHSKGPSRLGPVPVPAHCPVGPAACLAFPLARRGLLAISSSPFLSRATLPLPFSLLPRGPQA